MEEKEEKKKEENFESPLEMALAAAVSSGVYVAAIFSSDIGCAVGIVVFFISWPLWIIAYALGGPKQSEFLFGKSDEK